MKTLLFKSLHRKSLQKALLLVGLAVLLNGHLTAQCGITAQDTISKCKGQTYNLGSAVTVTGTTGTVLYSWDGGAFSSSPNKNVSPTSTTTYHLQITDDAGCVANKDITLKVLPLPLVSGGADTHICFGDNTQLCATASSANGNITLYNWIPGGVGQCKTVSPTAQSTYTIYVLDEAGCAATSNVTVFINPLPAVNAGTDFSMCLSQGSQQLSGTPAGGMWSGTEISPTGLFTPSTQTNYTLTYTYTNSQNCTNSDDVTITVTTAPSIDGGPDMELCLNTAPAQLPSVGTWSGSSSVSPSGLFTPNATGLHTLTVTNTGSGCAVTDQVQINVLSLPTVNAGIDISICAGQCAQLNALASSPNGSIGSFLWTGGAVSDSSISNPNACPTSNESYSVTVTDSKNCKASDVMNVVVNPMPVVTAGDELTLCSNSGPVTLTGQSPAGGTWSGTGVTSAGVYTPTTAGSVNLTYSYTTGTNCSASSTRTVHVIDPSPVDAGNDIEVCKGSDPIQLLTGGQWSGSSWVTSSGVFTPGATGSFVLTYSTLIGLCTSTDQIAINVLPTPVVNAGSNQTVCAGVTVNLNGSASSANGSITSYHWDESFVSSQNIHNPNFTASSSVVLTLTATDNKNCSASGSVSINVESLPVVDAGADITVCSNSSNIQLTGFSPAGGTWTGTGVTSSGVFTPVGPGTFTLTYTYTSGNNCSNSDTKTITVIDPDLPNVGNDVEVCLGSAPIQLAAGGVWAGSSWVTSAGLFTPGAVGSFSLNYNTVIADCNTSATLSVNVLPLPVANAGQDQSVCEGANVQLNGSGSSSNGAIADYEWNQSFLNNQHISNPSFTAVNTVSLTLTVTDSKNCSADDVVQVTVNSYPTVNAGNDISVCQNEGVIQLTGASPSGGVWSGTGVSPSGEYTISSSGTHTVTYSYTNSSGCTSSDDLQITVVAPAVIDAGPDISMCVNSTSVQLQPGGSWSGSTLVNSSGEFTPGEPGVFQLTYSVVNGVCTSTDVIQAEVFALPSVDAGIDASVCEGQTYQLNGSVSGGSGAYSYSWDNSSLLSQSTVLNPILTSASTVTLTLMVTDSNQCSAEDQLTVSVVPLPQPEFSVDAVACVNTPIAFSNTSLLANSFDWSFGNTATSVETNPVNTYQLKGVYTITLTAYNSLGCGESTTQQIEIVGIPSAHFSLSNQQGCSPLGVDFTNNSTGYDVSYSWDLDTGSSSDETPGTAYYTADSTNEEYQITLTASNICGSDVYSEPISVNPQPIAQFDTSLSTQCSPVITHFYNESAGNPTSYLWDFGDGSTSIAVQPSPLVYQTGDSPENFIIKLHAFNQCGEDVQEMVLTVLPNTIETTVTPSVWAGCAPLFVQFANITTGATEHLYQFDDGNNSQMISPSHIFETPGMYDVLYYANDGCSYDTLSMTIEVMETPSVTISATPQAACPLEEISFSSQTSDNTNQILWNFGDGNTSNLPNPVNAFDDSNDYMVGATVIAQNGCESSATTFITIHPKPVASMLIGDDSGCSPLSICPVNSTQGANSYQWNWGNGSSSPEQNPCFEYTNTDLAVQDYTIHLYAENEFACKDSTEQTIHVLPQPLAEFELNSVESCFVNEAIGIIDNTTNADSYQWYSDGVANSTANSPVFSFSVVGEHSIELAASNAFGCADSYSQTYTIHPTPEIDVVATPASGCAPLTVRFVNNTVNGLNYEWIFGDAQTSGNREPVMVFENPGTYDAMVTAISEHGCESVKYYEDIIEVFELPVAGFSVDAPEGVLYETTVPFINGSEGSVNYTWDFGDWYSSTETNPIHTYKGGGDYTVTLTAENEYGCYSEYSQIISIDNTVYVFVPSAFTPDNDGVNELFIPSLSSYEEIREYSFEIANRWGQIVFSTDNPLEGWAGNVDSGEYYVHNDVFNWTLTIWYNNGQPAHKYKGNVVALR